MIVRRASREDTIIDSRDHTEDRGGIATGTNTSVSSVIGTT